MIYFNLDRADLEGEWLFSCYGDMDEMQLSKKALLVVLYRIFIFVEEIGREGAA